MATIIDELVVELGLDPKKFTEGSKKIAAEFAKTKEQATSVAQNIEAAGKRGAEFFSLLRTQAIGLFATFAGGRGVKEFTAYIATNDAAVGRLAVTLGTTSEVLSKWRGAAKMVGGSADGITGSIQGLVQQFQQMAVTGESSLTPFLYSLGIAVADASGKMRPFNDVLLDLADRFHSMGDPTKASAFGNMMGLGPDMINLLIKGRTELQSILDVQSRLNPITEENVRAAEALQKSWALATGAAENLGRTILTKLTPSLMSLLDSHAASFRELSEGKFISPGSLLDSILHGTPFRGFGVKANSASAASGSSAASRDQLDLYAQAIANIESRGSGGYAAIGPITRSGDRAYGKYQVMGNNIPEWSQQALGRRLSIQEFMASPAMQDEIFRYKFGGYVKQYGNPQDAASAWLTGKPLSAGANLRDGNGTSGLDYVGRFNAGIGAGLATSYDNRSTTTSIGQVNVYTSAKDGAGIAQDFKQALQQNGLASQINYGPR